MSSQSAIAETSMVGARPRLSICIATYGRGKYIGQTLDSILPQMSSETELVIVDGASPDNTYEVMSDYVRRFPRIRYFRETENSGIDRDYDKAVGYARGEYCWLMTDDDLLRAGGVGRVLKEISAQVDLLVVNSEVQSADFSETLLSKLLPPNGQTRYGKDSFERLLSDVGAYLSFIGGVVIKRDLWLARRRDDYYGSLFIHVGVIFQAPIDSAVVIRDPLIVIRYGNAMWTARGFEIWMFKWPGLIWSFPGIADGAKRGVTSLEPWRRIRSLFAYRAKGSYSPSEYARYLRPREMGRRARFFSWAVAHVPAGLANFLMVLRCRMAGASANMLLVDLMNCRHATWLARLIARNHP